MLCNWVNYITTLTYFPYDHDYLIIIASMKEILPNWERSFLIPNRVNGLLVLSVCWIQIWNILKRHKSIQHTLKRTFQVITCNNSNHNNHHNNNSLSDLFNKSTTIFHGVNSSEVFTWHRGDFCLKQVHSGSLSRLYIYLHDTTMLAWVTPAWAHPGCCTGARISLRYKILQWYHVNAKQPHVSVWNRSAGGLEWVAHA